MEHSIGDKIADFSYLYIVLFSYDKVQQPQLLPSRISYQIVYYLFIYLLFQEFKLIFLYILIMCTLGIFLAVMLEE